MFIFHRQYFKSKKAECLKMLETHNSYYENTKIPIKTLIYLYNPENKLDFSHDFSIVGEEVLFEWTRVINNDIEEYSFGSCYINEEHTKFYLNVFDKYKNSCKELHHFYNDRTSS